MTARSITNVMLPDEDGNTSVKIDWLTIQQKWDSAEFVA